MQIGKSNALTQFVFSLLIPALIFAATTARAELNAGEISSASSQQPGKLIVHEWGTFTSFSGSNGVQLDFRPLRDTDLPDFVFDRPLQSGQPTFTKSRIRAQIRMETPVTYFYTDRERTVRASVEFPKGLLTEFYPPVASMAPEGDFLAQTPRPFRNSKLDWGEVTLIPAAAFAPAVQDENTKVWLQKIIEDRVLPFDFHFDNHYYRARETDSAFVHVRALPSDKYPGRPYGDFIEKFLFYRGVGKFDQPLQVKIAEDNSMTLVNHGRHRIHSLIRLRVDNKTLLVTELDQLSPGESRHLANSEKEVTIDELRGLMTARLEREGLFPREAAAMVNTWSNSWFAELGDRIFYLLAQELTEELIPLTITPKPDETVRVLVGRIEVISPSVEKKMLDAVQRRATHRAVLVRRHIEEKNPKPVKLPIPKIIRDLGRLAEPAMIRTRELAADDIVSQEAALLIQQLHAEADGTPIVAEAED